MNHLQKCAPALFDQTPRRFGLSSGSPNCADRRARLNAGTAYLQIGAPIRPSHFRHALDAAFGESDRACLCATIMRRLEQAAIACPNVRFKEPSATGIENVERPTRTRIDFEDMPRRAIDEEIDAGYPDDSSREGEFAGFMRKVGL
jgi:hypothetical protein